MTGNSSVAKVSMESSGADQTEFVKCWRSGLIIVCLKRGWLAVVISKK